MRRARPARRGARPATRLLRGCAAVLAIGTLHAAMAQPALGQRPGGGAPQLERGLEALRTGAYAEATRALADALERGAVTDRVAAARALARAHAATGDHEAALRSLDRASRDLPGHELDGTRGRILRLTGQDAPALAAFDAAIRGGATDAIPARLDRAVLLWERGDRAAANEGFEALIGLYNSGRARTGDELAAVAAAVRYLARREATLLHEAVGAYEEALAADPSSHAVRLAMADLFLSAYSGGEAQSLIGEVLEVNPRHAGALRALARAKRFEGSAESLELAERALEVDPASAEGRSLLALLLLELGDEEGAVREADRALATNPRHREALAVRAAARYLSGDREGYESDRRRALEIDPLYAGFYTTVAELAVRMGRYGEAVELAERAVALDSTAWDAWAVRGMNELRTGEPAEARTSLERAFAGDPFNAWTKNTLDLIDRLDRFQVVRTPRFELVMDPGEAALLAPYAEAVAEEAYEVLSERYGYRPETPVRVELYPRSADFSVRTMGLTGLGALGVAFGNVLAMDSPAAREAGTFHWASTLWHEIAHAVTLGLTEHRIPRWLTEGISVHEERRSRPGWGGVITPAFLQAYHADRLLPLEEINTGFVRPSYPGQVGVSYQHASLVVSLIEEDHGTRALRRLMQAYSSGQDTGAAFRDVLGVTPEAMDRRLAGHVEERYSAGLAAVAGMMEREETEAARAGVGITGTPGAAGAGATGRTDALVRAARLDPGDFSAQLAAGRALFADGRHEAAEPFLERARALWPEFVAPGSPYDLLARIQRERGDRAGAAETLRRLTSLDETALGANLELAELLESMDDQAGAAEALERAIYIYPYDPEPHDRLADLAVRLGRPALEVRERRALVALAPVDGAGALYRLALAQRRAGDRAAARQTVVRALELAPDYAEAQDLLLELAGGGG